MRTNNPFSLLKDPGFKRVWAVGLLANTMRWLEMLAIGIFVYEITGSALLVAIMTVARQLPLALFGSFIGPVAEKTNRKYLLVLGFTIMAMSSAVMALMASWGNIEIWSILICVFLNGTCWSLDYPVRRTLIGEFSGAENLGRGISLDSATNNVTRMIGPFAGGVIYGLLGLEGAFIISATVHFICVLIAADLILEKKYIKREIEPYFKMLKEGIRIVRNSPELIAVYLITIILNICGFPYASMVPVLGRSVYEVPPALIGFLSAAEGAGAFIGALIVAFVIRPAGFKRTYLYGSLVFLSGIFCLSFASQYGVAVTILLISGLGMAGFGAMQSTLVLLLAPEEARSRLMGLLSVCIGCAPIGLVSLGLMADNFGAQNALKIISFIGIFGILGVVVLIPRIRS